jgi:hypothetical protein
MAGNSSSPGPILRLGPKKLEFLRHEFVAVCRRHTCMTPGVMQVLSRHVFITLWVINTPPLTSGGRNYVPPSVGGNSTNRGSIAATYWWSFMPTDGRN